MNITQVLSNEHQNILKVIDAVLKECDAIENGKEVDKKYFSKVIDFIRNYADGYHHAKEEDILFHALLENIDNMHCNPIPVMLHEHDEGRNFVKGLEEGIANDDKDKVLTNAKGYCYLLQEHIYKEDNVLYPMAEEAISEERKAVILNMYKEAEAEMKSKAVNEFVVLI